MPYPGFQAFSPYSLKTPTPASLPGPSQAVSTPGRPSFPTQPGTGCLLTGTRSKPTTSEQGGRVPVPHPRLLNTRWLCWKHGLQHPECHPNPSLHSPQGWRDHTPQDMHHPPPPLGLIPPRPHTDTHLTHCTPLCFSGVPCYLRPGCRQRCQGHSTLNTVTSCVCTTSCLPFVTSKAERRQEP